MSRQYQPCQPLEFALFVSHRLGGRMNVHPPTLGPRRNCDSSWDVDSFCKRQYTYWNLFAARHSCEQSTLERETERKREVTVSNCSTVPTFLTSETPHRLPRNSLSGILFVLSLPASHARQSTKTVTFFFLLVSTLPCGSSSRKAYTVPPRRSTNQLVRADGYTHCSVTPTSTTLPTLGKYLQYTF